MDKIRAKIWEKKSNKTVLAVFNKALISNSITSSQKKHTSIVYYNSVQELKTEIIM